MAMAYFITFTTYGTWLHGTEKGMGSVDRKNNIHGQPFVESDANRMNQSRSSMSQPPYVLDAPQRRIVLDGLVSLCREKAWTLHAAHVRSNHMHLVVTADREAGRLMSDLKARASRDLTRAGFDFVGRTRWTRHGSTRHLFDMAAVADKIDYTLNEQGQRMACYDAREQSP